MTYIELVYRFLTQVQGRMDNLRPCDYAEGHIKSAWADLLDVYGRQGILSPSELQQHDCDDPTYLLEHMELSEFISNHPDKIISELGPLLRAFWIGDKLSSLHELIVMMRMLTALSEYTKGHQPRHNSAVHSFLRIAASRTPFWDGMPFNPPQMLIDLYQKVGTVTKAGISRTVITDLRLNLIRLHNGVDACVQQGRLEDAHAAGFHGITLLYHWYMAGLVDQYSRGQLHPDTPMHAFYSGLWQLVTGMSIKQH